MTNHLSKEMDWFLFTLEEKFDVNRLVDDGTWRYYIFQDGTTQYAIGVIVDSSIGEVKGE